MDAEKRKRYENIAAEIVRLVGGRDNILGVATVLPASGWCWKTTIKQTQRRLRTWTW